MNCAFQGYSFNAGTYRTLVLGLANIMTDGLGKIRRTIMPERLPKSSFRAPKRFVNSYVCEDIKNRMRKYVFFIAYFDYIYFPEVRFGLTTKLMGGASHFTDQIKVSLLDPNILTTSSTTFYQ